VHHIQKSIINKLNQAHSLSFSKLKPDDLDNKLFSYHLNIVQVDDFVEKVDKTYRLTPTGKLMWRQLTQKPEQLSKRAYSVLILAIKNKTSGEWLVYKRRRHPLIGKVGFMHATPSHEVSAVESAKNECFNKTGLSCDFKYRGGGFFRIKNGDELQSFTNFSLFFASTEQSKLSVNDEDAEYFWISEPELHKQQLLPNMPSLLDSLADNQLFFTDKDILGS
jgi:hypothetical protein